MTNNNDNETTKNITKITINAPIETVWAELIKTNSPLPFFFGSVCKTTEMGEGAPIRMQSPNGKYTSVAGTVTIFEPPYRYGHTFKFTHLDDPPCYVTYELKEIDGSVEFSLIVEGTIPGSRPRNPWIKVPDLLPKTSNPLLKPGSRPAVVNFFSW